MENKSNPAPQEIIDLILNAWKAQSNAVKEFFDKFPDAFYETPVAPGRNKAVYVLGHLIANMDGLNPLLGFGDKLFPQLDAWFQLNTPWEYAIFPPLVELKWQWEHLVRDLEGHFATLTPSDWLSRHTHVSAEDFVLDPKRNKLNVLLGRINHLAYHFGQLNLLI